MSSEPHKSVDAEHQSLPDTAICNNGYPIAQLTECTPATLLLVGTSRRIFPQRDDQSIAVGHHNFPRPILAQYRSL
jgi:hypothetical protein